MRAGALRSAAGARSAAQPRFAAACARQPFSTHPDFEPVSKLDNAGEDVNAWIKSKVDASDVVVFMKGDEAEPRCGFSLKVVQILQAEGVRFKTHNVLADERLRQGIKDYSSWPTIPQVYIKGEFVGGADIMYEMFQSGELPRMLDEHGVKRS